MTLVLELAPEFELSVAPRRSAVRIAVASRERTITTVEKPSFPKWRRRRRDLMRVAQRPDYFCK